MSKTEGPGRFFAKKIGASEGGLIKLLLLVSEILRFFVRWFTRLALLPNPLRGLMLTYESPNILEPYAALEFMLSGIFTFLTMLLSYPPLN